MQNNRIQLNTYLWLYTGDGKGLDTMEAAQQRINVLEYIEKHYKVLSGKILYENSMGTTVYKIN